MWMEFDTEKTGIPPATNCRWLAGQIAASRSFTRGEPVASASDQWHGGARIPLWAKPPSTVR